MNDVTVITKTTYPTFRSRFLRPDDDDDSSAGNRKSMHFDDDNEGGRGVVKKERIKVNCRLQKYCNRESNQTSFF
jgi:hypothetical protein